MNDRPFWVSSELWACPKHFNLERHPSFQGQCGSFGCMEVRPRRESFNKNLVKEVVTKIRKTKVEVVEDVFELCSWEKCRRDNGNRAVKRKGSKYCNDECRKAQARFNYKQRKKSNK